MQTRSKMKNINTYLGCAIMGMCGEYIYLTQFDWRPVVVIIFICTCLLLMHMFIKENTLLPKLKRRTKTWWRNLILMFGVSVLFFSMAKSTYDNIGHLNTWILIIFPIVPLILIVLSDHGSTNEDSIIFKDSNY